jgi:hypothetical protein
MSVWKKYHYLFYLGILSSFLSFCIFISLDLGIIAIVILTLGICVSVICAMQIKCPKCNTRLYLGHNLFSAYYNGYRFFLPKKCLKCGEELDNT